MPRLTLGEQRRLIASPSAGADYRGFRTAEWNCARVKVLIDRLLQVNYHFDFVGTLLHHLGWTTTSFVSYFSFVSKGLEFQRVRWPRSGGFRREMNYAAC